MTRVIMRGMLQFGVGFSRLAVRINLCLAFVNHGCFVGDGASNVCAEAESAPESVVLPAGGASQRVEVLRRSRKPSLRTIVQQ